jgi:hypothetical protein
LGKQIVISDPLLYCHPLLLRQQMTAFVFFIFRSAGEGEGWFEGDSILLIHYKKNKRTKNTDSHPAVLLNSFKFCAPVVFV